MGKPGVGNVLSTILPGNSYVYTTAPLFDVEMEDKRLKAAKFRFEVPNQMVLDGAPGEKISVVEVRQFDPSVDYERDFYRAFHRPESQKDFHKLLHREFAGDDPRLADQSPQAARSLIRL